VTTIQAIAAVRVLLDETGVEYYSPVEVLMALEQAQIEKALEYRSQGRKDFLTQLFRRRVITGNGMTGIDLLAQIPDVPLTFEGCIVRLRDTDPSLNMWAKYISPETWSWYRFENGNASRSPSLAYSYFGNKLWHNGAGTDCELVYYLQPMLPTQLSPILAREPHDAIVEMAASILNTKEVIAPDQIGEPNRKGLGSMADLVEATNKKAEQ